MKIKIAPISNYGLVNGYTLATVSKYVFFVTNILVNYKCVIRQTLAQKKLYNQIFYTLSTAQNNTIEFSKTIKYPGRL